MGRRWRLATRDGYRVNIDEPVASIDSIMYSQYAGMYGDTADAQKNTDTKNTFRAFYGGGLGDHDGFGGCIYEYIIELCSRPSSRHNEKQK